MATVTARGSLGIDSLGNSAADARFGTDTAAGWHMIYWWSAVIIIGFFLWAL